MRHLRVVGSSDVESAPTPAVAEDRKREILSDLIAAHDRAIEELGDLDPWKWACIGIRRRLALTLATSLDDVLMAFEPRLRAPERLEPVLTQETSAG